MIKFSIIIPTYNRAHLINWAIQSVIAQAYPNWQVIIVDDGSTDNTFEVVKQYQEKDTRIEYYYKENGERGAARNFGIKKANGDYITFLDSDDFYEDFHLQEADWFLQTNNQPAFMFQGYRIVDSAGRVILHSNFYGWKDPVKQICFRNILNPLGAFVKRGVMLENLFDEDPKFILAEDLYVWLKIIVRHGVVFNHRITSNLVEHSERSMNIPSPAVIKYSYQKLIENLKQDEKFCLRYSSQFPIIQASHQSLKSLSYAMSCNRKEALRFLYKAVLKNKEELLKRRNLLILLLICLPDFVIKWRYHSQNPLINPFFNRRFFNYFLEDFWQTMLVRNSSFKFSGKNIKRTIKGCKPIKNVPENIMFADPFPIPGYPNAFLCEYFDYKFQLGKIAVVEFGNQLEYLNHQIVLELPTHLSYPFVFEHQGTLLFMPENSEGGNLSVYKLQCVEGKWESKVFSTLFTDKKMIDSTLLFYNNKYWLFYSESNGGLNGNNNLCIAFSNNITGPYQFHPQNPVKIGDRGSRSAGKIIIHEGKLYRPSQDCSITYGGGVILQEITHLSDTGYSEKEISFVTNKDIAGDGIHTINEMDNTVLVDVKYRKFMPFKIINRIKRRII